MSCIFSLKFSSPPSLWGIYPRILTARKPALVPEWLTAGGTLNPIA